MSYRILRLSEHPDRVPDSAQWFSKKWGIPLSAYRDSMREMRPEHAVPQWYVTVNEETGAIVCAEEHNIHGGLGAAVAEVLAYYGCGAPTEYVGIRDVFTESAPYKELLKKYGVDADGVIAGIERVLERK